MTPTGLMRTLLPSRLLRPALGAAGAGAGAAGNNGSSASLAVRDAANTLPSPQRRCDPRSCLSNCRCFAHVNDIDTLNRDVYFTPTPLRPSPRVQPDHNPPDERTLRLGKTVRTLHDRLPTLLQTPLPSDILSPQISLHLFPSTHPHLPTVSGRIAYIAALWTAPVAWGRLPLVGNVKLTILSERMVRNGAVGGEEKLIVKWKTCGKTRHRDSTGGVYNTPTLSSKDPYDKIRDFIAGTNPTTSNPSSPEEEKYFHGIFVFEFDSHGRIIKHVIEHTEEGGHWDQMPRVVSVTDWLLGRFNGKGKENEQVPELAWCQERPTGWKMRCVDRRGGGLD